MLDIPICCNIDSYILFGKGRGFVIGKDIYPEDYDLTVGTIDDKHVFVIYRWHYKPSGEKSPWFVGHSKPYETKGELLDAMDYHFPHFKEILHEFRRNSKNAEKEGVI
jgi:hypothetical protein